MLCIQETTETEKRQVIACKIHYWKVCLIALVLKQFQMLFSLNHSHVAA